MVKRRGNLFGNVTSDKKEVILLPIYEMVGAKKSSKIKNVIFGKAEEVAAKIPSASAIKGTAVDLVKRTASATKERVKARGVTAGELAVGSAVIKATTTAAATAGATGIALTAVPWVAGFVAAGVAGGILKTVIDGTEPDNDKN